MISKLTSLLKKYSIFPKKKLGQHFLINNNILNKELEIAGIQKNDIVLEIGAGPGVLTEELAKKAKKVFAIEKDEEYANLLKKELINYDNIEIIHFDALKIEWPKANKIVSNIPYKISSKIMDKLSKYEFELAVICFQKEFAERLCAIANDKNYSKLSVFSNYYFEVKKLIKVNADSFYPKPKVYSQIVEIKKSKKLEIKNESEFFEFIKAIFCYKRKSLKNAIAYAQKTLKKEIDLNKTNATLLEKKVVSFDLNTLIDVYESILK